MRPIPAKTMLIVTLFSRYKFLFITFCIISYRSKCFEMTKLHQFLAPSIPTGSFLTTAEDTQIYASNEYFEAAWINLDVGM